ncbi:MAG: 1-acyl-sn-glycerol-3-phosphate acyltransferase [Phycisphaerales bacterium]|nr:1-acyl-sn-glycerol-3-phosphate acyltransferase [Phycisphaerales bacterium]
MTPWYRFKRRNPRRSRLAMFLWWTLVPWILIPLARVVYGFRIHGRRHCPSEGPVLVICNHQSMLDPMIAGLTLRERGFRPLARMSLKKDLPRLVAWLMSWYDVIFIDPDEPSVSSFKDVLKELKESRVSIMFPEGARSSDGCLAPFQPGVWVLIRRGKAPVLPMAVEGPFDVMPPGSGLRRRGRIEVKVGTPIPCAELLEMGREAALEHLREVVDDLRMELRADIRKRSRGRWPRSGPADQSIRDQHRSADDVNEGA